MPLNVVDCFKKGSCASATNVSCSPFSRSLPWCFIDSNCFKFFAVNPYVLSL